MKKKIRLLTLAAASVAVLALPAAASAFTALHLNPTPAGTKLISGGAAKWSTTSGLTVTCNEFSGTATFNAGGTTGNLVLTFNGDCRENLFGSTCTNETPNKEAIVTTSLPFDLVTLPNNKPGVLVTPNAGHFVTFECAGGLVTTEVKATGIVGTVVVPECAKKAKTATLSFRATADGQQEHKKLAGTETIYDMTSGGNTAALELTATIAMNEEIEMVCT